MIVASIIIDAMKNVRNDKKRKTIIKKLNYKNEKIIEEINSAKAIKIKEKKLTNLS